MTAKQNAYYWRLWHQACAARGWSGKDRARRHQVHVQVLGFDMSHEDFSNQQFDGVIRALKLLANPDDLSAVMFFACDPEVEQRKRLIWRIEQTAPREYVQRIAADKFGTIYYHDLNAAQLEQLRNTVVNRMRAKQKQKFAPDSSGPARHEEEMETAGAM
jgi:hypothetical protein